ncbi:helix-turn-helix transcriptional regulator [Blautia sp. An81]|nr:helix-turn-helix transcriptional regulator [Blautia sp. An81]OUN31683.1 transcriptional regulator [Blautia sp. An81]
MKFNEKLLSIRKKKGLSQEQLGMELQVSRQTISKWEAGVSQTKGY